MCIQSGPRDSPPADLGPHKGQEDHAGGPELGVMSECGESVAPDGGTYDLQAFERQEWILVEPRLDVDGLLGDKRAAWVGEHHPDGV